MLIAHATADLEPSDRHDQLRDVLLGNRTEQVLRAAHRPLLWVPASSGLRRDTPAPGNQWYTR
jgi:hypothetical protein